MTYPWRMADELYEHLDAADPAERARAFVGCCDGVLFDHRAGAGAREPDHRHPRETFRCLLRAFAV